MSVWQAASKEEREAELVRRVREAVSLGLGVLDADFDKLDVDVANSDSDDDDASAANAKTPVMFERKVSLPVITICYIKMPSNCCSSAQDVDYCCILHCVHFWSCV